VEAFKSMNVEEEIPSENGDPDHEVMLDCLVLSRFQNVGLFGFSRYKDFAMYLKNHNSILRCIAKTIYMEKSQNNLHFGTEGVA
jgi:hypothetical protein